MNSCLSICGREKLEFESEVRMNKFVIAVLLIVAAIGWKQYSKPKHLSSVATQATAAIEIYGASYCGECRRAKAYMKSHGIEFVDYDVEKEIDKRREFYERGGKAIPLLFIRGERMEGFDEQRFESLRAQAS